MKLLGLRGMKGWVVRCLKGLVHEGRVLSGFKGWGLRGLK